MNNGFIFYFIRRDRWREGDSERDGDDNDGGEKRGVTEEGGDGE